MKRKGLLQITTVLALVLFAYANYYQTIYDKGMGFWVLFVCAFLLGRTKLFKNALSEKGKKMLGVICLVLTLFFILN